jgi:MFS family permease
MNTKGKLKKSLKVSFWDGVFASCMQGFTADYFIPYALALKASVGQVGMLTAFSNLTASVFQLRSADISGVLGGRKKTILIFVFLHLIMGLPIIFTPYLFRGFQVWALVIFVTLFNSFNAISGPVWLSLMSDHIPARSRGRYFGWRNKILGMIVTFSIFVSGFILHSFKNNILRGFLVIFGIAFICRFISWCFLSRMYEVPLKIKKEDYFSFRDFIKGIRTSNFGRFVLFVAGINFSVNLAAPFFSVFMLRDLKFNYITYTFLITTVSLASLLTIDRWGRSADKIGNIKVLRITSLFISSLPLFWIINQNPFYLFFAQVLSGFAWSGFNLCVINFVYDAVSPPKRMRCIAYLNAINGCAIFLGALCGGYLANRLPNLFGFKLLSLFLLASVLRFVVSLVFSGKIKEVRPVQKVGTYELLSGIVGLRPVFGTVGD